MTSGKKTRIREASASKPGNSLSKMSWKSRHHGLTLACRARDSISLVANSSAS